MGQKLDRVCNNTVSISLADSPYTLGPGGYNDINVNTAGGNVRVNLPNADYPIKINKTSSDSYLVTLFVAGTQIGEISGELSSVVVESGQITKDEPWYPYDAIVGIAGVSGNGGEILAKNKYGKVLSSSWRGVAGTDDASVLTQSIAIIDDPHVGGRLLIGKGTYYPSDALIWNGVGVIEGMGVGTKIVAANGKDVWNIMPGSSPTSFSEHRLSNMCLDGNSFTGRYGIQTNQNVNKLYFDHLIIKDFASWGVYEDCDHSDTYTNCIISENGQGDDETGGIYIKESNLIHLIHCNVEWNGTGILVNGGYGITIIGSNIEGNYYHGIWARQTAPWGYPQNGLVEGCMFEANNVASSTDIYDIFLDSAGCSGWLVSGCRHTENYVTYGIMNHGYTNTFLSTQAFSKGIYCDGPESFIIACPRMKISPVPLAPSIFCQSTTQYVTESSGSSTGTGTEQTIAHGLATIPTGCKAWIRYPISATVYAEKEIRMDATNIYPKVKSGLAYDWRVE